MRRVFILKGKVKIDVFGILRDPVTGKNSLPLNKYFSLLKYLGSSDIVNRVELHYFDTKEVPMENYPEVQKTLQSGRPEPVVVIDGAVKYSGDIPYESVYQDAKRILATR